MQFSTSVFVISYWCCTDLLRLQEYFPSWCFRDACCHTWIRVCVCDEWNLNCQEHTHLSRESVSKLKPCRNLGAKWYKPWLADKNIWSWLKTVYVCVSLPCDLSNIDQRQNFKKKNRLQNKQKLKMPNEELEWTGILPLTHQETCKHVSHEFTGKLLTYSEPIFHSFVFNHSLSVLLCNC